MADAADAAAAPPADEQAAQPAEGGKKEMTEADSALMIQSKYRQGQAKKEVAARREKRDSQKNDEAPPVAENEDAKIWECGIINRVLFKIITEKNIHPYHNPSYRLVPTECHPCYVPGGSSMWQHPTGRFLHTMAPRGFFGDRNPARAPTTNIWRRVQPILAGLWGANRPALPGLHLAIRFNRYVITRRCGQVQHGAVGAAFGEVLC